MSEILKKELVYLSTAVIAIIMFIEFFFNIPAITAVADTIRTWVVIISTMAIGVGVVAAMRVHGKRVMNRTGSQWLFSAWLIFVFVTLTVLGLSNLSNPLSNPIYNWVYANVYRSLSTSTYAMTGFYIFSAAYRAFRARNVDASILLLAGCLVILTNATIGEVILSQIPILGRWVLDIGQLPAVRVFLMVTAFGMLSLGFKVLIGKEKGYYAEVD